jgi:hypothetical protein
MLPDSLALVLPNYVSESVEAVDLASLSDRAGHVAGVLSRAGDDTMATSCGVAPQKPCPPCFRASVADARPRSRPGNSLKTGGVTDEGSQVGASVRKERQTFGDVP